MTPLPAKIETLLYKAEDSLTARVHDLVIAPIGLMGKDFSIVELLAALTIGHIIKDKR